MENLNTLEITLHSEKENEWYYFKNEVTKNIIWNESLKLLDNITKQNNVNQFNKLNKILFDKKLLPEFFKYFWDKDLYILKNRNIIYYPSSDDLSELKELRYLKLEEVTEKDFDFFN